MKSTQKQPNCKKTCSPCKKSSMKAAWKELWNQWWRPRSGSVGLIMAKFLLTIRDARASQDQLNTVKRRKGDYASFSELFNTLKNVLSLRIARWTLLQSIQLLSLPRSHGVVLTQIVTYVVLEKGIENKGFGRTMIWALELEWLVKRHISGWSDVEQWEIEPIALVVIELHLPEGVR